MNYNEKYEKNIEELIQFYIEEGKDGKFLLNELNKKYQETDYPGYIHKIGILYEQNILKSDQPKKHIHYYSEAANQNYLPALIKLLEICLENIDYETSINSFWFFPSEHHINLCSDGYGEYLLSKYKMIHSIINDNCDLHFLDDLSLMESSASKGCREAVEFMENIYMELKEK